MANASITLTLPRVGYSINCGLPSTSDAPKVRIATEDTDMGWWATATYKQAIGSTTAIAGPYVSRAAALSGLREHMRNQRAVR